MADSRPPLREIRATYDDTTITVYQAYSPAIGRPAVEHGRFVAPFSTTRMTWIKPSFLWMMHRSGWGSKTDQTCVLAIRITREGFEQALAASVLSHLDPDVYADRQEWSDLVRRSPVRVQWDPERTVAGTPLPWRSLQVGLGPQIVPSYVNDWIVGIEDISATCTTWHDLATKDPDGVADQLPREAVYPLPAAIAQRIGATPRVA